MRGEEAAADAKGKLVRFNPAASHIMGLGAIKGGPAMWLHEYGVFREDKVTPLPPDEFPVARALRGETTKRVTDFLRNAGHPETIFVDVTGTVLRDPKGNAIGGVMGFQDVTPHREIESEPGVSSTFYVGLRRGGTEI